MLTRQLRQLADRRRLVEGRKREVIDAIRSFNPTARPTFLEKFEEPALREYLQHLDDAREKRPRIAGRHAPDAAYRRAG